MLILEQREIASEQQSLKPTQDISQPQVGGDPLQSPLVQHPVLPAARQVPKCIVCSIYIVFLNFSPTMAWKRLYNPSICKEKIC